MKKYTDVKLLDEMGTVAAIMADAVEYAHDDLVTLVEEYEMMSDRSGLDADSIAPQMDRSVGLMDMYTESVRDSLADFDKGLAKLIALRLRLAEAADLPVDLTGGKVWARNEEYTL